VGKPTLWRYYGLWALLFLVGFCWALLGTVGRVLKQEWLFEGSGRIGAPIVGPCFLVRGLDFIVLCKRYPLFLKENALAWDTRARKASPAALLCIGIWFTLGGAAMAYFGGRNLVLAVLSTS
jgi:hypothetical protein